MFVAGTEDWAVDTSLAGYDYPIYIVWCGKGLIGVCGDRGGLDSLFLSVLADYSAKKIGATKYRIMSVTQRRTREWEGHILPDTDESDGDTEIWTDGKIVHYHVVITEPGKKPRKRSIKSAKKRV